jgi:hypothetical protein
MSKSSEAAPAKKRRKSILFGPRYTRIRAERAQFRPLAVEVGWIVYEWNLLQNSLAGLFSELTHPVLRYVTFSIWHSVPSDRTQREMLRSAIEVLFDGKVSLRLKKVPPSHLKDDLLWLLKETHSLADQRNNAIHSPLIFVHKSAFEFDIIPADEFMNPRAKKLGGKNLLEEFVWYRKKLEVLADFAGDICIAMRAEDWPWPHRPRLPYLGQSQTRKTKHRRKPAK